MRSLLFIKCEFLCIAILIMLFIYSAIIKKEIVRNEFNKLAATAVAQLSFEYIGICLLNLKKQSIAIAVTNRVVSAIYVLLVLNFCYTFLKYIVKIVFSSTTAKKVSIIALLPLIIYSFLTPFIDFEYVKGTTMFHISGGYYGMWITVGMVYAVATIVILIVNRQRVEQQVVVMFEIISFTMIVLFYIQLIVPEMYLLGCVLTLVTIATYLSIENNADSTNYRMSIDIETGVKNKKAYKEDINKINNKYFKEDSAYGKVTFVLFDILGMKAINEQYGLVVGDEIIARTADIISRSIKNVNNIYRIRGDVFAAVYIGEDESEIITGCKLVGTEVARTNKELPFEYHVTIARISKENTEVESMEEIITLADKELEKQKDIVGKKMNT